MSYEFLLLAVRGLQIKANITQLNEKKIYTERINKQILQITSLFTTDFREKVKRVWRCSVTVDICSVLPKPLPIRNNEVWLNNEGKDSVLLNPVPLTFHFKCHNRVFSIREQTSTVKRMRKKSRKCWHYIRKCGKISRIKTFQLPGLYS